MQFFTTKKNLETLLRTGAFMLIILSVSCESEEEQNLPLVEGQSISMFFDKEIIQKAELMEKLAYKNYHLTYLMEEVIHRNGDFDSHNNMNALKRGSINETFKFKDLLGDVRTGKGEEQSRDSVQFSLEAFIDLEGESWQPNLKKIKEGDEIAPLFLINSFDPSSQREVVLGYVLNDLRKMELKYRDLSQENVFGSNPIEEAKENAIYVLGISLEEQEDMLPEIFSEDDGGGGGSNNNYVKMEYVKIKDKKESWVEKADVKFEVVATPASSLNPGEFSTHCGVNAGLGCYWNGSFLAHCNNSEVGKKRLLNREMGILQHGTFADIAVFVIFEYDSWPAPTHVYEKILNGESLKVGYRSYQSPYDEMTANFHDQNPYNLVNGRNLSRNISDIEYNLK